MVELPLLLVLLVLSQELVASSEDTAEFVGEAPVVALLNKTSF